jgi:opacity protein-like surface antigen
MKKELSHILVASWFLAAFAPATHGQQKVVSLNRRASTAIDEKESARPHLLLVNSDFGGYSSTSSVQGTNADNHFVVDTSVYVGGDTTSRNQQSRIESPTFVHRPSTLPESPSDLLPFARNGKKSIGESYPRFGFGVGSSSFSPRFDGLQSILNSIEDRYRELGYSISHNTAVLDVSPFPWYILSVRFSRTIGTLLEFGSSSKEKANSISALTATVLYHPDILFVPSVKPYIGAGIGIWSYNPNQTFSYGDRVSPIDSNGSYKYLASVTLTGSESKVCVSVQGGIAVEQESNKSRLSFQVYATRIWAPAIEIHASGGRSSTVEFGKMQVGGRLLIYL